MEHICSVFCHGGFFGYEKANLSYDASFIFSSGIKIWAQRDILLRYLFSHHAAFDQLKMMSCQSD